MAEQAWKKRPGMGIRGIESMVRNKAKKFFSDFWSSVNFYWSESKWTMLFKLVLYLLTTIIPFLTLNALIASILGGVWLIVELFIIAKETDHFQNKMKKSKIEFDGKVEKLEDKVKEFGKLERDLEIAGQINEKHLKSFLIFLTNELKLERSERISVYYRNEKDDDFEIISRYSSNPSYLSKGRLSYEKNKGFISKCWEGDSDDFIKILPEVGTNEYYNDQAKVGYTRPEIDVLTMKPRLFYVLNISKTDYPSIGVVVIESTKDRLSKYMHTTGEEERIRKLLNKDMSRYTGLLYDLMDKKIVKER